MSNEEQNPENHVSQPLNMGGVSGSQYLIKHQLEYSSMSCKVSWCPKCKCHFYNDRNSAHTTLATAEHYHFF